MKLGLMIGALSVGLAVPAAAAPAMSVQQFLTKAEALKRKGALAMFSGDLKLLMQQVKADSEALRAERLAAKAAGKAPAYCPPERGTMSQKELLDAMQAVPAPQRPQTSTRSALRASFVRRFPCRG